MNVNNAVSLTWDSYLPIGLICNIASVVCVQTLFEGTEEQKKELPK
jgi:hypothetical protein